MSKVGFKCVGISNKYLHHSDIQYLVLCDDTIFFASVFHIFATKVVFSARPPLFFASLNVLISDRAHTSRHLDFDEQS
jgi:hypothetical protein